MNFKKIEPCEKTPLEFKSGEVITYLDKILVFTRIPRGQKNWYAYCEADAKKYRIPLKPEQKYKIIGQVEDMSQIVKPIKDDREALSTGNLFVVKRGRGQNCELYRFLKRTEAGKIHAINPLTNRKVALDEDFVFTLLKNLPY
jgi:hypothetical protein